MKKTLLVSLIALAILFVKSESPVYAAIDCEEFSVDPSGGAPAGTTFQIRARNCPGLTAQNHTVYIYDYTGLNLKGSYTLQSVGSGLYIALVTNITTPAHYLVTLHNVVTNQNSLQADMWVQEADEEGNPTFQCQTIGGVDYCMRCVTGGAKPGCFSAQGTDVKKCPSSCQREYTFKPELCNSDQGVQTAIGCIPFQSPKQFMGFFISWGIGIGGGVAMLLVIYSGMLIMTSAGDPGRLQGGKDLMTSALVGVLLIIFSIFVMRILGVQILGLF